MERIFIFIKKLIPRPLFRILQPPYHYALALLAALFSGFPSRKLVVIGVTGTDGKSTTVSLLHEILARADLSVASVSSLRFKINGREEINLRKMTMLGRFFVQRFLRDALKNKAQYVILEVTSEGIKQFRHKFIKFDAAVLTNVTPEHIESHGTFEKYRAAKGRLFAALGESGLAIINRGDPSWEYFAKLVKGKKVFYGRDGILVGDKLHHLAEVSTKNEISFRIDEVLFRSKLFGAFNLSNILAAISTLYALGLPIQKIADALREVPAIPGRLEVLQEKPFRVVVDYAHTPNALRNVYETLRSTFHIPHSRLICVLGAAGGSRDKWKRPELGKIAGEFCGEIIITNEDPYDEPPHEIIDQVAAGIPHSTFHTQHSKTILDRREAIREALHLTKAGDTVVITGKGAEQFIMGPNNTKIPWDDRKAAREELNRL